MPHTLEILRSDHVIGLHSLEEGTFVLGSDPMADIRVDDPGVPPRVAEIAVVGSEIEARSMEEPPQLMNGHGHPVHSTVVEDGGRLLVGGITLAFRKYSGSAGQRNEEHLREELLNALSAEAGTMGHLDDERLRVACARMLERMLRARGISDPSLRARLRSLVLADAVGLGPLDELLEDRAISEITVNGPDVLYVERQGVLERSASTFRNAGALRAAIERIVWRANRRIDESSPMVDVRLPDGSRVHVALPPVALSGPYLTIRKHRAGRMELADLVSVGTLSNETAVLLDLAVQRRVNLLISGGPSTGKTTLLNALAKRVSPAERVVTIEDAAELSLQRDNLCRLETRPPNAEGVGEISLRDLARNALRMRPDRLIVGECRGGEALDMVQAMNSGCGGCMATLHAASTTEALVRLETMVHLAGESVPASTVRRQVATAVGLVIQLTRKTDGRRLLTGIAENVVQEDGTSLLREIKPDTIPHFLERFLAEGGTLPPVLKFWENPMPEQTEAPLSPLECLAKPAS